MEGSTLGRQCGSQDGTVSTETRGPAALPASTGLSLSPTSPQAPPRHRLLSPRKGTSSQGEGWAGPCPPLPTLSTQGYPGPAAKGLVSGGVLLSRGQSTHKRHAAKDRSSQQGSRIEAGAVRPGRAVHWGGGLPPGPAARPPGPAPRSAPRPRGASLWGRCPRLRGRYRELSWHGGES